MNEPKIKKENYSKSGLVLIQMMKAYNSDNSSEIKLKEKLSSMNQKAQDGCCTY